MEDKDIEKYAYCMEEIKLRMIVISSFLGKQWTTGYVIPDNEAVCIQFRKVLELIALASLAANKDEYARQYSKFARHWNAGRILRDLQTINPGFYPRPTRQILDQRTKRPVATEDVESGYMTKDDFVEVYDRMGEVLHASNPYGAQRDVIRVSDNFREWHDKIVALLNHHQVQLLDADRQLWVMMNADNTGKVAWAVMEKVPDEEVPTEET